MQGLTEGRITHYILTQQDADEINRRRVSGAGHGENWPAGAQAHIGNPISTGEHCPMMVVKVWDRQPDGGNGCCNGQVLLDGNDSLWVTSRLHDPDGAPGTWHWIEQA